MIASAIPNRIKAYREIERHLESMGKSFNNFPSFPRIDTSELDDDEVIDRAKEEREYLRLRSTIEPGSDQAHILDEFIRVGLFLSLFANRTLLATL
jgi:hypothetical protein